MKKSTKKAIFIVTVFIILAVGLRVLVGIYNKQGPPYDELVQQIVNSNPKLGEVITVNSPYSFTTNGEVNGCLIFNGKIYGESESIRISGRACYIQTKWVFHLDSSNPEIDYF